MKCEKDDLGTCCGLCHFNPIVVIATHARKEITTANIRSLNRQSFVPKIVVVCSTKEELEYYKTLGVTVILEPNTPLGRKWQCGANVAFNMNADPMIILGSDDILHYDYVKYCLQKLNEGFEFVGSTSWYNYDTKTNRSMRCSYQGVNIDFPIGSGKAYSKGFLSKIRARIFDPKLDRRLDDLGHQQLHRHHSKIHLIREPMILAIKGKWSMLNPTRKYLISPNIKVDIVNLNLREWVDLPL